MTRTSRSFFILFLGCFLIAATSWASGGGSSGSRGPDQLTCVKSRLLAARSSEEDPHARLWNTQRDLEISCNILSAPLALCLAERGLSVEFLDVLFLVKKCKERLSREGSGPQLHHLF